MSIWYGMGYIFVLLTSAPLGFKTSRLKLKKICTLKSKIRKIAMSKFSFIFCLIFFALQFWIGQGFDVFTMWTYPIKKVNKIAKTNETRQAHSRRQAWRWFLEISLFREIFETLPHPLADARIGRTTTSARTPITAWTLKWQTAFALAATVTMLVPMLPIGMEGLEAKIQEPFLIIC